MPIFPPKSSSLRLHTFIKLTFWLIVGLFSILLIWIAASYFHFNTNYHFLKSKQEFIPNRLWLSAFYIHLASGITAIVSGFPLFFEKFISPRSRVHKRLGKLYVYSILLLSGPTGFYLAFFAEGGPVASIGFIIMSLLWMSITLKATQEIVNGNVNAHRAWMIRSFCFTLSGVTLRLYTPFGFSTLGFDYELNFMVSAWLPWILNLLLGELILMYDRTIAQNRLIS